MWPRSPESPSEISIAACATVRKARPSAMRGIGACMRMAAAASVAASSAISPRRPASASRASPSVPEIQMSSPGRAASRRNACRSGTSPNTVMQIVRGPLVVSPPISSQPCRSASASKPQENGSSQAASASGKENASVNASGLAPIAARSDRLTARHLWPRLAGSAPAKKCRPSTSMSVETASCMPGAGASSAQSSPTPSAAWLPGRNGRVK
jgi:hypothetical protein